MLISAASGKGGTGKTNFTQAQIEGQTILEYDNSEQIKSVLVGLWEKLRQEIDKQKPS